MRIILVVLGALLAAVTLFQILMGDADEINWFSGIILPIILITQAFFFTYQGKYMAVKTHIECYANEVKIVFFSINRYDKAGVRDEEYLITPADILQFQYSRHLTSIRIIGRSEAGKTPTYGPQYEMVLYPPAGEIQEIISALENSFDQAIVHMDL